MGEINYINKKSIGQCQITGCTMPAKFYIYKWVADNEKVWIKVCDMHDREIGAENLQRQRMQNEIH